MLVLSLAGCGESRTVSYDADELAYSCESVLSIIASGQITPEGIRSMSEWNQGYLMAQLEQQTGVQMDPIAFADSIAAWNSAAEECGVLLGHEDYTFKATSSGVTAICEGDFETRDSAIEFAFNKELVLESVTVSSHYSTGEILSKAGLNTLLGMGTVFVMLVVMSLIISLFKFIPDIQKKMMKKHNGAIPEEKVAPVVEEEEEEDDLELVAVIAAAIAAYEGTSTDDFVVRSIKRRTSNKWNA